MELISLKARLRSRLSTVPASPLIAIGTMSRDLRVMLAMHLLAAV